MAGKNSHITYYIRGFMMTLTPRWLLVLREKRIMAEYARRADKSDIDARVDYYNRLAGVCELPADASRTLADHTYRKRTGNSTYFFDTFEFTRYFSKAFRWMHQPGDVTSLFDYPTVVKSRPLADDERGRAVNSVVMKLDKVRHFMFVNDPIALTDKKPVVLFRGDAHGKPGRIDFLDKFMGKEGFDAGDVGGRIDARYRAGKLSIGEHLHYRYIMALEGYDVASNLKWVMSSNCVAVMPRPTCETWFMEGTLRPDYHYIEIKPDYSDIEERISYYNSHPDEAQAIMDHAHEYVRQFLDRKKERIVSYLVMRKYFAHTAVGGKVQLP